MHISLNLLLHTLLICRTSYAKTVSDPFWGSLVQNKPVEDSAWGHMSLRQGPPPVKAAKPVRVTQQLQPPGLVELVSNPNPELPESHPLAAKLFVPRTGLYYTAANETWEEIQMKVDNDAATLMHLNGHINITDLEAMIASDDGFPENTPIVFNLPYTQREAIETILADEALLANSSNSSKVTEPTPEAKPQQQDDLTSVLAPGGKSLRQIALDQGLAPVDVALLNPGIEFVDKSLKNTTVVILPPKTYPTGDADAPVVEIPKFKKKVCKPDPVVLPDPPKASSKEEEVLQPKTSVHYKCNENTNLKLDAIPVMRQGAMPDNEPEME